MNHRVFAIGVSLLLNAELAFAQWPVELHANGRPTLSPLLEQVTPAVVNISVTGKASQRSNPLFEDPFFRRFFDLPEQGPARPTQSVGSGVIVNADKGYVLTNHHVIANADEVTVTLQDRRRFVGKVIGSDDGTDIALLQIDADSLHALEIGDSTSLKVGDFVLAIGNPFGLGQTVTSGIVSALGRSGLNIEGYEDFIQTDASINPGNSGGALVDLDGRLVGINTAIIAPAGGNVGIGFAVPTHMAKAVMDQLLEYGEVRRGRLGIVIQDLTPDLAKALDVSVTEGAVVTEVEPESPAEAAGFRAGDVVVAVDGKSVSGSAALRNLIGLVPLGQQIDVKVLRDGRQRTLSAEIGKPQAARIAGGNFSTRLAGAEFTKLDRNDPDYRNVEGVLVARVEQGSPAWRAGLRGRDVVLAVNRVPVRSVEALSEALDNAGPAVALHVMRGNSKLFIVIQ